MCFRKVKYHRKEKMIHSDKRTSKTREKGHLHTVPIEL